MLTSDLDNDEEKDKAALDVLLTALLAELNMQHKVGLVVGPMVNLVKLYESTVKPPGKLRKMLICMSEASENVKLYE